MHQYLLPDGDALREFEANIKNLVEHGHGQRAIAILRRAAEINGHHELAEASSPETLKPELTGWDHVRRDCAAADGGNLLLTLKLIARSQTSPDSDQGRVIRELTRQDGEHQSGVSISENGVKLAGLDPLFAIVRQPHNAAAKIEHRPRRDLLACWLIIAQFIVTIQRAVEEAPLPAGVAILLREYPEVRPMESGYLDLLPNFTYTFTPHSAASPNAAAQLQVERKAENSERYQKTWTDIVAQTREVHRMLGYFPFYRAKGRRKLAELWEYHLKMGCDAAGLNPVPKISWRMSGRELAAILQRMVEAKKVPDVADAMNPAHTDSLHREWVMIAKPQQFKLGAGYCMFQLQLASALNSGGPWVEDRWEHAKPYAEEMKLGV